MPSLIKIKMNCIDGKNFEAKEKYMQLLCNIRGTSDPNHFIFEINVGKRRIRLFPTLISKIKWLESELSLIAKVIAFKGLFNSQETLNSYMYTLNTETKRKFRQIQNDAYKSLVLDSGPFDHHRN